MRTLNKELQNKLTPELALQMLKDGNHRFVNNLKVNRNLLQQINETKEGQYPMAVILSCIDSRTSAELVFDQGLGDIFSVRLAGNVLNDDVLGSMEYACKVAGSKIVLVLGHTKCGAIKGACDGVTMGHITQLLNKVRPAIVKTRSENSNAPDAQGFADLVAVNNVHLTIEKIIERSEILRNLLEEGAIDIVGGMYDVESGIVEFYEEDKRKVGKEGRRELISE